MKGQSDKQPRLTIGVLSGWQAYSATIDSFLHQVFLGIHSALQDQDCNLLLAYGIGFGSPRDFGPGRPAWPLLVDTADFAPVGPWNTDGLIVAPPIFNQKQGTPYFQALRRQGYPIVFAGYGETGPSVVADNTIGIRQALEHLVAHGHRQIAFISGHENQGEDDSRERLRTYHRFLAEHGLESNPALIASGSHTTPGGRRAMAQILQSCEPFSAVLASNDLSAVGAREILHENGLSVPEDVALIGFDDRIEARAMNPQLTTVHYPMFEVGYQSALLLLEYLRGQRQDVATIRVPTWLVVRESCGCILGETLDLSTIHLSNEVSKGEAQSQLNPASAAPQLTEAIYNGNQPLNVSEVEALSAQMVSVCHESLRQGEVQTCREAIQSILDILVAKGDLINAWQTVVSILREWVPDLPQHTATSLSPREIDEMIKYAQVALIATAQGQHARYIEHQANAIFHINQMAARFNTAQEEADVFAALMDMLPSLQIDHAVVAFYEKEDDDPVAWSVIQVAPDNATNSPRFPSRQFPPTGLYSADQPFHLVLTPLWLEEETLGFVAYHMSNFELYGQITTQLAAALRGVRLYRTAVESQRLAEEANRLKSRFLSMVSHELRTPLNLIAGLSDLLLRETNGETPLHDNRREDLERIYLNSQHLDGLIRDVLDLTRIEFGQLQLSCAPLDMAEVLEPIIVISRQLAQEKQLTWHTDIPESLPYVWGDRLRLRQVILNLVNNAIKFTAQGEVTLSVSVSDDTMTVTVHDTGLGIPQEEQDVIFEEFRQSERTTTRGYGGLGLGLAICKLLVDMHQGSIGVRSSGEEWGGSEFYFSLPVMKDTPLPILPDKSTEAALPQLVWLFVEDVANGQLLQEHFANQDIEFVTYVITGEENWRAVLSDKAPDAVVLDKAVTAQRGWEIVRMFKDNPQTSHTSVLFYTLDEDDNTGALLELDFLTKPINTANLTEMLGNRGLLEDKSDLSKTRKILVVEDDADILSMHSRILQTQLSHYQVLQARNGLEALQIMAEERPDLVLLDLMMPELDGFGVLEKMQAEPATRNIPVVILTSQVLTEEDMARLNRGTVSILGKGVFNAEETLKHIKSVLDHRRKTSTHNRRLVHKAMAFIHTNYMEPLRRDEIAARVGLSERHLNRCFQEEIGVTPMIYLNRYRIKQAKTLLESSQMGITEIAMAVGFSSSGYFIRVFRKETGITPHAYQLGDHRDGNMSEKA